MAAAADPGPPRRRFPSFFLLPAVLGSRGVVSSVSLGVGLGRLSCRLLSLVFPEVVIEPPPPPPPPLSPSEGFWRSLGRCAAPAPAAGASALFSFSAVAVAASGAGSLDEAPGRSGAEEEEATGREDAGAAIVPVAATVAAVVAAALMLLRLEAVRRPPLLTFVCHAKVGACCHLFKVVD